MQGYGAWTRQGPDKGDGAAFATAPGAYPPSDSKRPVAGKAPPIASLMDRLNSAICRRRGGVHGILKFRWTREQTVARLVGQGFLVRVSADIGTLEARRNDASRLEKAIRSGAQFIASDDYPGMSRPSKPTTSPASRADRLLVVRSKKQAALRLKTVLQGRRARHRRQDRRFRRTASRRAQSPRNVGTPRKPRPRPAFRFPAPPS